MAVREEEQDLAAFIERLGERDDVVQMDPFTKHTAQFDREVLDVILEALATMADRLDSVEATVIRRTLVRCFIDMPGPFELSTMAPTRQAESDGA